MTFSEIYNEVMAYLPNTDIDATEAKKYVNRAYIQMAGSFQFYALEQSATFDTADGDYDYTIETVNSNALSGAKLIFDIYNETDDCPLEEETIDWWQDIEVDPASLKQAPEYWIRYGGEILLHPTPDGVYTLRVRFKANPAEMTTDGESPVYPEEWHEAIVLSAASKAAFRYGVDNTGINLKNEFLALLSAIQEEHTMQARRRVGQITPEKRGFSRRRSRRRHAEFDN